MAVTLINSISSIPGSPTAGDIVRFSAAITAGIPSTVKKANGTTRETAIVVGSEYRYIGTNWLKIGGDEIVTTPLKDATVLASSEFEDMIMGAVHNSQNSGRLRQFGASLLHQALQVANPLGLTIEDIDIFSRDYGSELWIPNAPVLGTAIDLDIKEGTTRHSFADDYFAYSIVFTNQQTNDSSKRIANAFMTQAQLDLELPTDYQATVGSFISLGISSGGAIDFRKLSDTSIAFRSISTSDYLHKIIGHKFTVELETP